MKKIAFIIPGFGESKKNNPAYMKIAGYFKTKGINPIIVDIDWKYKVMTDYVEQFKEFYAKHVEKGAEVYILGFSYGAMVACISSPELKPKIQILCSLSPFFKEDMNRIKEWWKKYTGKKRINDLAKISFNDLAKKISSKTYILAGDKEGIEVEIRARETNNKIKNSRLIFIPGAKHMIGQKEYLTEVKKMIDSL